MVAIHKEEDTMKHFRRLGALLLAVLLVISNVNVPVFAAETVHTAHYEFDITPDMVGEDGSVIVPLFAAIDQTFTMTSSHTGSTRQYVGNHLAYGAQISGAPGNILAVQFFHSSGTKVAEEQFWCNGEYHSGYIPIVSGNSYYIKYLLAYGTPTPITVHMYLNGVYL